MTVCAPMDSAAGPAAAIPTRDLPWLALLSGLAVLLNTLPVPFFYGIHVLLGSVPAILALLLWRGGWGVAIGVLASLQTWSLWGHPWAVVIFTLEMVWLWLGLRRFHGQPNREGNGRVVMLAMGYWLLLGAPLVFAFYGLVMRLDLANLLVVAVKQSFNGVLNTVLAFSVLILIRAVQAGRGEGPGLSLRGVIMALALLAVTLPTLVISITAGHQLQSAVQQGALEGLKTISLAVERVGPGDRSNRLLIEQMGSDLAYRRIDANGQTASSDPALFQRLDGHYGDGGRSQVRIPDLALLIPREQAPVLHKWIKGYWSYSQQYDGRDGTSLIQVVEPARPAVARLQLQSSQLLGASMAVLVLGALISAWVGERVERAFTAVVPTRPRGSRPAITATEDGDLGQQLRMAWHRSRQSGEPLACLCLQIDGLAAIHQHCGQQVADHLLNDLSGVLRGRLRRNDQLYRSGDGGFVVLAKGCQGKAALRLAEGLQRVVSAVPLPTNPAAAPRRSDPAAFSVSVGISSLDPDREAPEQLNADSLMTRARRALERARLQGNGQLVLNAESA
jgi:diguanylate cyclase (GGDEF)-like protein